MRTRKNDIYAVAKKETRKVEKPGNNRLISTNTNSNGSLPKRYQSVFDQDTPLTSFGIHNNENHPRTHSPPNRIPPQTHHRPLKPVKEFLVTHPLDNAQRDDYRRSSSSHTNGFTRSQIEATVQNVNLALTQTFNKLRQESSHPSIRSTPFQAEPSRARPVTPRLTTHQNTGTTTTTSSNFYYETKASLPVELISKRSTNIVTSNILPNNTTHNRFSTGTGPLFVQRVTTPRLITRPNDNINARLSTPLRTVPKSPDTGLDKFNFDKVILDEYSRKSRTDTPQNIKPRKQSPSPRSSAVNYQHQVLPEVSVNPQIQSTVRANPDTFSSIYQPTLKGETHTSRYHIQVEPTHTFKHISPRIKSEQLTDVKTNTIVQHQRTNSPAEKPFNEVYIEQANTRAPSIPVSNTPTPDNSESTSTLKQEALPNPPPSPLTTESNYKRKKQRTKNPIRANTKHHRPSSRLGNYDNVSDSELTLTETQSKDDANHPPSDLLSDVWSDLTNEFNDIKLRKNPNIRTSTPNITRRSSSLSSKEIGQMRKQIYNLRTVYNDLLKRLDIDTESMPSSLKSTTSSQMERQGRRHRLRKVVPIVVSKPHQSNPTMRDINQRFSRLETSIVTLAESIAKLSAQVQMQRVMKDDVYQLRSEVAELRQQLSHQQSSISANRRTSSLSRISPQPSRLITADVQHVASIHSTNPINISTTYFPSTSILDPRRARKIEQFFGAEVMLRYFLSLLKYDDYASVLEREKIGFYELPFIDERKLQSFGIPYGPCVRMIYESQQYFISLLSFKSHGIHV